MDPDAIDPTTITSVHGKYPKIVHYSALPAQALVGSINGLLSGVLAYAGAQLFVEFMAVCLTICEKAIRDLICIALLCVSLSRQELTILPINFRR